MTVTADTRREFRQFSALPCVDGFDVICTDTGRPVDHRETLREANGVAYYLNLMAQAGALARALGGGR